MFLFQMSICIVFLFFCVNGVEINAIRRCVFRMNNKHKSIMIQFNDMKITNNYNNYRYYFHIASFLLRYIIIQITFEFELPYNIIAVLI